MPAVTMLTENNLQAPLCHLNGTSKKELLEQLENAYTAIGDAYDVLKRAAPNARDYYPLGAEAMARATDQHYDRLKRLDSVRDELTEIAILIQE